MIREAVPIILSAAQARQPFHGCTPDYIASTCHASCCRSSSHPYGFIHAVPTQQEREGLEAHGATIDDEGLLQPRPGEKGCPFQDGASHLCQLHGDPAKPIGCIASPFTVSRTGRLVIRNRYRLLRCFKDGDPPLPAFQAFSSALEIILGREEAQRATRHLEAGGGDLWVMLPRSSWEYLTAKNRLSLGGTGKKEAKPHATPEELWQRFEADQEPAPWQCGIPLRELRSLAAAVRPLQDASLGRFAAPREADIARARSRGEAIWSRPEPDADPDCLALFRIAKRASSWGGFGSSCEIPSGALVVRHASCLEGSESRLLLLLRLLSERSAAPLFFEAWTEIPGHAWVARSLGLLPAASRVLASSEIRTIWAPPDASCTPSEPAELAHLNILDPAFLSPGDQEEILQELAAWIEQEGELAQHYSSYNRRRSWTAIALRGFDPEDPSFIEKPSEMPKAWKAEHPELLSSSCSWTRAASSFPAARRTIERLAPVERARIMAVAPGGELTRHADITNPGAGVQDGELARLHIPLQTSEEAAFRGWLLDGREIRRHFPARSLCYLDQRKPHALANEGELPRYHLVVDVPSSGSLRDLISKAAEEDGSAALELDLGKIPQGEED